jgi:lipopolysaccharide biosynthesis regulator YciM
MEDDPEQADYIAMYATIASERRGDGRMDDLIAVLDTAIRREPQNERARFARAQIYKRMNRMDVAIRDFRWVAEQNPRNLDAVRELRLYQMRRGSPASSRSPDSKRDGKGSEKDSRKSGGLFGKLFKR